MIPISYINEWRQQAPWPYQSQVEQDLVLSRALVSLYQEPLIQETLAFRGGTALNKLFCDCPTRYSEDIDLVQISQSPMGPVLSAIRQVVDPWLGNARWSQSSQLVKLTYRFLSEDEPSVPLRLKIEVNTIEPFSLNGFQTKDFSVDNHWFSGVAKIKTYDINELMATKLRALYQRLKGRDLYDLWLAVAELGAEPKKVVSLFNDYNKYHGVKITRAEYERNLTLKMHNTDFLSDAK